MSVATIDSAETLVDAASIAEKANVHTQTILKWARAGRIPCVRLSKACVRFRPSVVLQILEQGIED